VRDRRRGARLAAGAAGALLALGACTAPAEEAPDEGPTSVTVAWDQPFTTYNAAATGSTSGDAALAHLTRAAFAVPDGEAGPGPALGTAEVLSQDPLRVRYALAEGATWSDGVPVDAADLLLDWAAGSGALDTPAADAAAAGEGAVLFGGRVSSGLARATAVPEVAPDGRSLTLAFDEPVADWPTALGAGLPAHVVARQALGATDPRAAKDAVVDAVQQGDPARLAPLSRAWATGSALLAAGAVTGAEAAERFPSTGPYAVREAGPDQVVLERTAGGEGYDQVVLRHLPDPQEAVRALAAGEVDVVSPPATAAVLTALRALEGVEVAAGAGDAAELLLLRTTGSRNPGVLADARVRQALARVVPRQEVVDELVAPVQADAVVRDSFLLGPADPGYAEAVAANGSAAFDDVDVDGARALLAQAGVTAPQVCVLHDPGNPRRAEVFALLQESAARAGFRITDCGAADWAAQLSRPGAWDAVLLGARSSGDPTDLRPLLTTGGAANPTGYSDPAVDGLFAELAATTDGARRAELVVRLDAALWQGAPAVPLFQAPALAAWSDEVLGVTPSALPWGVLEGVQDWRPAP